MKKPPVKYLLYATLLNAYQDYLDSDKIWSEYWGFSENPPFSEEDFREKKRLELIDRINRVPFDSEKADRGTAFNEIVDGLILGRGSDKIMIKSYKKEGVIAAAVNSRLFDFPVGICREFADYYKGAAPQVHTEAILPTRYGEVQLYGYIDYLSAMCIHDLKTTGRYGAGKFKSHWQHLVYPYCLHGEGNDVSDFEYNILLINERAGGDTYETFTEHYGYAPERDVPRLTEHVESLIAFIELHRDVISDKKIFNLHGA